MEDKIISVLNNVRTNLSNELETKRKELVKPFDDFADNINNKGLLLSFSFGIIFLSSLVPLSLFFFFGWFGFVPFYMLQLFTN